MVPPKPLAFIPFLYFHRLCSPVSAWALSLTHEEPLQFLQLVSWCLSLPKYLSKLLPGYIPKAQCWLQHSILIVKLTIYPFSTKPSLNSWVLHNWSPSYLLLYSHLFLSCSLHFSRIIHYSHWTSEILSFEPLLLLFLLVLFSLVRSMLSHFYFSFKIQPKMQPLPWVFYDHTNQVALMN